MTVVESDGESGDEIVVAPDGGGHQYVQITIMIDVNDRAAVRIAPANPQRSQTVEVGGFGEREGGEEFADHPDGNLCDETARIGGSEDNIVGADLRWRDAELQSAGRTVALDGNAG